MSVSRATLAFLRFVQSFPLGTGVWEGNDFGPIPQRQRAFIFGPDVVRSRVSSALYWPFIAAVRPTFFLSVVPAGEAAAESETQAMCSGSRAAQTAAVLCSASSPPKVECENGSSSAPSAAAVVHGMKRPVDNRRPPNPRWPTSVAGLLQRSLVDGGSRGRAAETEKRANQSFTPRRGTDVC